MSNYPEIIVQSLIQISCHSLIIKLKIYRFYNNGAILVIL
jgi:hypothetical protein